MQPRQRFHWPLLVLVFVLGGAHGAPLTSAKGSVWDPWQATGLDFAFVNKRLKTEACHRSQSRFLACMNAAQALLEYDPRSLRLMPAPRSGSPAASRTLARFGSIAVVEPPTVGSNQFADLIGHVQARGERMRSWRELYWKSAAKDIDFSALRDWLLTEVVDNDRTAAYAAAAINGYLSVEDAHARIVPAKLLGGGFATAAPGAPGSAKGGGDRRYSGIGVALQRIGNMPIVTELIPGSPAAAAGIRRHDVIVSVDDQSIDSVSIEAVINRLRGPEGTPVALQLKRGDKLLDMRVVRGEVELKNVVSSVLREGGSELGYIRIHSFVDQNTCNDVRRSLDELVASQVSGLILDLRNNIGGRIDQAGCVADLFLEPGLVVLEMRSTKDPRRSNKMRTRFRMRTELPLVTLVNAGTGSASEVLAGALRDHGRSVLAGERTFGKGTIQTTRPWNRSGSIMKFSTTARYYLPSGAAVQRVGLAPDLAVPRYAGSDEERQPVLRVEDLYPTTLPAVSDSAAPAAVAGVDALTNCVASDAKAVNRWRAERRHTRASDYPLYRARELLVCML